MKYQIKLYTQDILSIIICFILLSCSSNNNTQFIIDGNVISSGYNYSYNPDGFINTPYGKVNISTKSYFKNNKLINLFWNRANGFLEYSIEDLRNDPKLYQSFNVDSLFLENKKRLLTYKKTMVRNDTIFYKKNQKVIILGLQ